MSFKIDKNVSISQARGEVMHNKLFCWFISC